MLSPLQLELTRLIGKKEWTSGLLMKDECGIELVLVGEKAFDGDNDVYLYSPEQKETCHWFNNEEYTKQKKGWEIIGHPATLSDLHRWMNEKKMYWRMEEDGIDSPEFNEELPYDSSKDLLEQEEETLKQIISLIKYNDATTLS